MTKGKYELGRQLYFDPRVSLDGTVSCATCHNPARGWTDGMAGLDRHRRADRQPQRPTVINTAYGKTMFWDGRAPSLEGQAQGPIQNPIEMGKQNYKEIIDRLAKIPGVLRAVRESLRNAGHARRDGQGDRDFRAGRRALRQLSL